VHHFEKKESGVRSQKKELGAGDWELGTNRFLRTV
jgi:hypothetical protein